MTIRWESASYHHNSIIILIILKWQKTEMYKPFWKYYGLKKHHDTNNIVWHYELICSISGWNILPTALDIAPLKKKKHTNIHSCLKKINCNHMVSMVKKSRRVAWPVDLHAHCPELPWLSLLEINDSWQCQSKSPGRNTS